MRGNPTDRQRRTVAGLLAVTASLSAHALLAAVAGVSLFALGGRGETPPTNIEIDLAAPPAPPPETMPLVPAPPAERPGRVSRGRHAQPALAAAPAPSIAPPPPPASASLPDAPPVLFAMSAGTVAARGPAPPNHSGSSTVGVGVPVPASDPVLAAAAVDVPARLVASRPATYPASARRAEVEADVTLEIVVAPDGGVISARVVAPRGYGLDGAALEAVRSYRFSPAWRAGRPVPVRMRWTVQFRLR